MQLSAVRIWVDDLSVARRFYGETLGLRPEWEFEYATGYDVGGTLIIEVDDGSEPDESLVGRFAGVSLRVDDVEAAHRDLTAKGVAFEAPPERMSWGGVLAHFRDPAGNVLTLVGA